MTKTNDNTNDTEEIANVVPKGEESIEPKPSREDLFIRNIYLYKTIKEAALKAGYAKNTANSQIYTKMKSERFRNKVRQHAIDNDLLSLPKILFVEEQVLNHLMKNPLEVSKYRHVLREKKKIAGILQSDPLPEPAPTINIKSLRIFWENALPLKPVNGEIIEDAD